MAFLAKAISDFEAKRDRYCGYNFNAILSKQNKSIVSVLHLAEKLTIITAVSN
jgi:hypothetical protein